MNKFKVGDRVVRLQDNNTSGTRVGDKGTVTNVGENRILVRFDRIGWERANFPGKSGARRNMGVSSS